MPETTKKKTKKVRKKKSKPKQNPSFSIEDVEMVDIDNLTPDPMNARVHPERNILATMASLEKYGQMKPIVVRKQTMVVVAGNGTLTCAKRLGWDKIAAYVKEMTESEALGYALADNRTSDLAAWDHETVQAIQKLLEEQGDSSPGWNESDIHNARAEADIPEDDEPEVERYGVLIVVDTEEDQLSLIEELSERELECRALTI